MVISHPQSYTMVSKQLTNVAKKNTGAKNAKATNTAKLREVRRSKVISLETTLGRNTGRDQGAVPGLHGGRQKVGEQYVST